MYNKNDSNIGKKLFLLMYFKYVPYKSANANPHDIALKVFRWLIGGTNGAS